MRWSRARYICTRSGVGWARALSPTCYALPMRSNAAPGSWSLRQYRKSHYPTLVILSESVLNSRYGVTPAKNLLVATRPFAGFDLQSTSRGCPAAHEVPTRDVSLTIRRNGMRVADPLNMTSGTSCNHPHVPRGMATLRVTIASFAVLQFKASRPTHTGREAWLAME